MRSVPLPCAALACQFAGVAAAADIATETGYYFSNLQAAVAAAADSGVAGGAVAWQRAHLSGVHPDYRNTPIWAIKPRGDGSAVFANGFED